MRRQRLLGFPVLLSLALLIVQHISLAQVTNAQPAPTGAGLQQPLGSSTPDQALSATDVLARMDSARQTVRRMLEEARAQRDVIKTLCLDDKLNQIDVTLRSARDQKGAIDGALQNNDLELANHQSTKLSVLRQRTEQLMADANLCISQEAETVGEAAAIITIDPSIADEPAYYPPGIIIIEPPPTGSVIK